MPSRIHLCIIAQAGSAVAPNTRARARAVTASPIDTRSCTAPRSASSSSAVTEEGDARGGRSGRVHTSTSGSEDRCAFCTTARTSVRSTGNVSPKASRMPFSRLRRETTRGPEWTPAWARHIASSRPAHQVSNARSSTSRASAKASRVRVLRRCERAMYAGCEAVSEGAVVLLEALAKMAAVNLRRCARVVASEAKDETIDVCAPAVRCSNRGAVGESYWAGQNRFVVPRWITYHEGECMGSAVDPREHHIAPTLKARQDFADNVLLIAVVLSPI